jgi:enoyl-CoA hydratase/carnithine racemase
VTHDEAPAMLAFSKSCEKGFELALECDLIVAGRSACLAFPEGPIGILTFQGGGYHIAERNGTHKAIELAFLSEPGLCRTDGSMDVINRVVDDHLLSQETEALAIGLASGRRC